MSQEPPKSASEYPAQVWVVDGRIHSGYPNTEAAEKVCDRANTEAAVLGLEARYEVREKAA